jgi:hypothetical protein
MPALKTGHDSQIQAFTYTPFMLIYGTYVIDDAQR